MCSFLIIERSSIVFYPDYVIFLFVYCAIVDAFFGFAIISISCGFIQLTRDDP
jgi:hypothetical protein